jgi:YidC/Oxa1 family membrane protein insertase
LSILNPIDDLVAWVITHIYNLLSPAFGATSGVTWVLTIAALVVLMRLIMVPLFIKQMHTQRAMTALTPRITELRKKHKGDKEKLNAETMKLYQEAGVNPLMGCLPVVLQMPIFFALFSVLREIADYGAKGWVLKYHLTTSFVKNANTARIFGVSIKDTFLHATAPHIFVVVGLTVLISMATTYLTVRQSMKRGMMPTGSDSPMGQSQKYMAYIMPFFALTGLYWPFGLVLYWVTTNLWTLGQQFVLLRRYPVGAAALGPDGNKPISGPSGKPRPAGGITGGPASTGTGLGKAAPAGPSANGGSANGKPSLAKPSSAGSGAGAARPGRSAAPGGTPRGRSSSPAAGNGRSSNGVAGSSNGSAGAGGHDSATDGGLLRRFGRGRPEAEPPTPIEPETKIVRQQRPRQPRSKRSGNKR